MRWDKLTDRDRKFIARCVVLDNSELLIELEESMWPRTSFEMLQLLSKVFMRLITGKDSRDTKRAEELLTTLQRIFRESTKAQQEIALIQALDSSSEEALLRIRSLIFTCAPFRAIEAPLLMTAIIISRIGIQQFVDGSNWFDKKS
jgi:hypothetical protein